MFAVNCEARTTQLSLLRFKPLFAATILALGTAEAWGQASGVETALPEVTIRETPSTAEKYQLPATTESVTAAQMAETINVTNTEDALKYLPSQSFSYSRTSKTLISCGFQTIYPFTTPLSATHGRGRAEVRAVIQAMHLETDQ